MKWINNLNQVHHNLCDTLMMSSTKSRSRSRFILRALLIWPLTVENFNIFNIHNLINKERTRSRIPHLLLSVTILGVVHEPRGHLCGCGGLVNDHGHTNFKIFGLTKMTTRGRGEDLKIKKYHVINEQPSCSLLKGLSAPFESRLSNMTLQYPNWYMLLNDVMLDWLWPAFSLWMVVFPSLNEGYPIFIRRLQLIFRYLKLI